MITLALSAVFLSNLLGCAQPNINIFVNGGNSPVVQPTNSTKKALIPTPSFSDTTQPPVTTPVPQTGNDNLLDTMSRDERYQLNIFLSNFSEAKYMVHDKNEIEQKIFFAFKHNMINVRSTELIYTDSQMGIAANDLDRTLIRFFGSTIPHETPAGAKYWHYENGNFMMTAAFGESCAYFSSCTSMKDNKNGTYDVTFNVYFSADGPHNPIDNSWYYYTDEQAAASHQYEYSGSATIRPKVYNGTNTYELISYHIN